MDLVLENFCCIPNFCSYFQDYMQRKNYKYSLEYFLVLIRLEIIGSIHDVFYYRVHPLHDQYGNALEDLLDILSGFLY